LKITNTFYKNSMIIFATLLLCLFFMNWYKNDEVETYLLFFTIFCLLFSYRFTKSYIAKNSLSNLVKRKANILEISRLKTAPFSNKSVQVSLEVSRISKLRIGNDWLSIIVDGNGNGYDFQLVGTKEVIVGYLTTLFSENELSNIDLKCI
jgi:hypothetical protein